MKNLKENFCKVSVLTILACSLLACSSGDDGNGQPPVKVTKTNVSGIIEKGPFVQGSKVILYELLLPIPQQELSFNMYITQNPGY